MSYPDAHHDYSEYNDRQNEDYILTFGDPILEVELDYAMEKMGVDWTDPHYGYWRNIAEQTLQCSPPPIERPQQEAA